MIPSDWRGQIFEEKKKIGGTSLRRMALNQTQNEFLEPYLEFGP